MNMPTPVQSSRAPVYASALGAVLAVLGALQTLASLVFAVQLIESDRSGGLFGWRVGMLMVIVVCIPIGITGTIATVGGIGAFLRKKWGYIASVIAAVFYAGGAALTLLFALGNLNGSALVLVALAVIVLGVSAAVIAVMVRALVQAR